MIFSDQAKSFSGVAAYYELIPASLSGGSEPERVWGQGVSSNFFDVLELPMVLGRGFSSGEDRLPVVVISARLWQRRFAAITRSSARPITLSGRAFTVVGIAPASFHSVDQILDAQFWVPLGIATQLVPNLPPADSREFHWLAVIRALATRRHTHTGCSGAGYARKALRSRLSQDRQGQLVRLRAGGLTSAARKNSGSHVSRSALDRCSSSARDCRRKRREPALRPSRSAPARDGSAYRAGCYTRAPAPTDADRKHTARPCGRIPWRVLLVRLNAIALRRAPACSGAS